MRGGFAVLLLATAGVGCSAVDPVSPDAVVADSAVPTAGSTEVRIGVGSAAEPKQWPVAIGTPKGIAPDGSAALVLSPAPPGPTTLPCDPGILWRVPFDGSPTVPAFSNSDNSFDPTAGLQGMTISSGRAAWVTKCGPQHDATPISDPPSLGFPLPLVVVASISPEGFLSDATSIPLAEQLSGPSLADLTAIYPTSPPFTSRVNLAWQPDGSLAVETAGIETLFFDGDALLRRAPGGLDAPPLNRTLFESEALRVHAEGSLVYAAGLPGAAEFDFRGRPILAGGVDWDQTLAVAADYSGAWVQVRAAGAAAGPPELATDCPWRLQSVLFNGLEVHDVDVPSGDFFALHSSPDEPDLIVRHCQGITQLFSGDASETDGMQPTGLALFQQFGITTVRPGRVETRVYDWDRDGNSTESLITQKQPNQFDVSADSAVRLTHPGYGFHLTILDTWSVQLDGGDTELMRLSHPSGAVVVISDAAGSRGEADLTEFRASATEDLVHLTPLGSTERELATRWAWLSGGPDDQSLNVLIEGAARGILLHATGIDEARWPTVELMGDSLQLHTNPTPN